MNQLEVFDSVDFSISLSFSFFFLTFNRRIRLTGWKNGPWKLGREGKREIGKGLSIGMLLSGVRFHR